MHVVTGDTHPPRVAVIVLTWNGRALTLDCLESLAAVTTPGVHVMLVDNASTDGTVGAVRKRFGDNVEIVANNTNLGFAGGNNAGIQRALDATFDYILLLNNDTIVDPGFIDPLLTGMSEKVGIAGPKIYYYTPSDQIWFAGGEVSLHRGTARHIGIRERDLGQHDSPRRVDYISGCALMARRDVFERIGLLDPGYRAYFEDVDFCMRATRAGFDVIYAPRSKVWHRISASTGGQLSRRKIVTKLRSSWRFFRRYARPHHWLVIPFFFAADAARITAMVLSGRIHDSEKATRNTGDSRT